jgi:membrane peptidoglycan carboxypeptidase
MTSYGDPHAGGYDDGFRPSSGRAQVPQSSSNGYGYDDSYVDPGYPGPGPGPYGAPTTGRASVPAVSGRARVPVAGGRAPISPGPSGRAPVSPGPSGRASVRPAVLPPRGGGFNGGGGRDAYDDDYDDYDEAPKTSAARKRKRARLRKWLIAGLGVFILLMGGGLIGVSYFYDDIKRPEELSLKNSTDVFAADGQPIAKLGNELRTEVSMDALPDPIKHALIAGEDKNFFKHHGIDFMGIARAAWNNLTGGETQGASTITQQYARQAVNDLEVTFARKFREAVMARKLEDTYDKKTILGFYLNTVYFGRGANGIGAAAEIYFKIKPENIGDMSIAQAAVLGAVLKQPNGKNGFDPANNPTAAEERWNYVLNNMVENNWLSAEDRAKQVYPRAKDPQNPGLGELQLPTQSGGAWGYTDRGTGHVIDEVEAELEAKGVLEAIGTNDWRNAGLKITTTINPVMQKNLELQLNRQIEGSTMYKQRTNVVGAGIVIDQHTGRILAYYGGNNNGTAPDFAQAPVPPASSFKIYTLAAALEDNISIKSHWDPTELKRAQGDPIDLTNANREGDPTCGQYCTLEDMAVKSFNVPFYNVARTIGASKVVTMANKAGIRTIWDNSGKPYDISQPAARSAFDPYVGFGKFDVRPIDHAVGTATIAASGVYHEPHFVLKVERKNKKTHEYELVTAGSEQIVSKQAIRREVADEVTSVLKQIAPKLNGAEAAGKTGTWENGLDKRSNAHAWFTGYTSQFTATIWVGSVDGNKTPIKNPGTGDVFKSRDNLGSAVPKEWWKNFANAVNKELNLKPPKLPAGTGGRVGSADKGDGVSPTPAAPDPNQCNPMFPQLCPPNPGGGGGNPNPRPSSPSPSPSKKPPGDGNG